MDELRKQAAFHSPRRADGRPRRGRARRRGEHVTTATRSRSASAPRVPRSAGATRLAPARPV